MSHQFIERTEMSAQEIIILNRIKNDPNHCIEYYAKKLMKPPQLVAQVMENNGIEARHKSKEVKEAKVVKNISKRDEIVRIFKIAPFLSARELSEIVECSIEYIQKCVRNAGLKFINREKIEARLKKEKDKKYIRENLGVKSMRQLAEEVGRSKMYIQVLMKEIKIENEIHKETIQKI